jgi:hypothetical protein
MGQTRTAYAGRAELGRQKKRITTGKLLQIINVALPHNSSTNCEP